MVKFWGGGVGKSGVPEHKSANISETRNVKIEKSYYGTPIGTHQLSFEQYHPDPLRRPLPQDWGFTNFNHFYFRIQERVKLRTSNLAGTFTGSIRTKAGSKFWRK